MRSAVEPFQYGRPHARTRTDRESATEIMDQIKKRKRQKVGTSYFFPSASQKMLAQPARLIGESVPW